MTLSVGIAGMGFGATVHLPALLGIEEVRVAALADSGSGSAGEIASKLCPDAEIFTDGRALARHAAVDLVVVATPPAAQAEIVMDAIEAGKAVFCEKPFGASLDEAKAMTERAEARGCANAVGFQFRYERGLAELIEAAADGVIGEIHRIEVAWLTSGGSSADRPWTWRHDEARSSGVFSEFCSHVLDYLALLAGAPVSAATMRAQTIVANRPGEGGMRKVTTPDRIEMLIGLGATTAHVCVSNVEPLALGHRIVVHGSRGRLTFHHRPSFRPADLCVEVETREGRRDLRIDMAAAAAEDSRIPATRALLAAMVADIAGSPDRRLPDFRAGLAVRRAMEMVEASIAA